ncbi:hypothetical protein STEG23_011214 [Scotinomys teguina]
MLLLSLLTVLLVQHSQGRTHSLRYFRLAVSDPGPGVPEFLSVGYVDSHPITTYDSVTRQKEPRAPWMAENLAPDHWERYTQLLKSWQQTFTVELKRLQRHYNHSGLHTYQRMIGCELLEDGSTTGLLQYAYDGQDFLIFNKDALSWVAVDNVAHITKQAWDANLHELQYQKNWLEEECIAWLKRFLEYGKDTLERTVFYFECWKVFSYNYIPCFSKSQGRYVKQLFPVFTMTDNKEEMKKARGFYPPEISMMWMKNGEDIAQEVDYGAVLPSGDGTYQMWVSVDLDPQSKDTYSCHVEHCGLQMVLEAPQADFKYSLSYDPILPNILFLRGDLQVDYSVSELQGTFSS